MKRYIILNTVFLLSSLFVKAQSPYTVLGIVTDYGPTGLWQSSTTALNPIKPDNSHNLLAFTFRNSVTNQIITYSTGVNDNKLSSANITFQRGSYQSILVNSLAAPTNNTKIALGQLYDGEDNGPKVPPPDRTMTKYLVDDEKTPGLNLGTGVANLPAGTIEFKAKNIISGAVGDGVPDILITQIADPNDNSGDTYRFYDNAGNQIGNPVSIIFKSTSNPSISIAPVGSWLADFYEAVTTNTPALGIAFTKQTRDLRLWAADFSAFGITQANYASVDNFKITLSGNSDLAFVAYNADAFSVPLPVELINFKSKPLNGQVQLTWQTASESSSDYFEVETSKDGVAFLPVAQIPASGRSSTIKNYKYLHQTPFVGTNYYRLKQVDANGSKRYSPVIAEKVIFEFSPLASIQVRPNPFQNQISLFIPGAETSAKTEVKISSVNGKQLYRSVLNNQSQPGWVTLNDLPNLKSGMYLLKVRTDNYQKVLKIVRE